MHSAAIYHSVRPWRAVCPAALAQVPASRLAIGAHRCHCRSWAATALAPTASVARSRVTRRADALRSPHRQMHVVAGCSQWSTFTTLQRPLLCRTFKVAVGSASPTVGPVEDERLLEELDSTILLPRSVYAALGLLGLAERDPEAFAAQAATAAGLDEAQIEDRCE